jgi:hypothetical protein
MVSVGSYLLGAVQLALVAIPIGFSAYRLRQWLLPAWTGAAARLVEIVAAVALLIWLSEILGLFGLLYAGTLIGGAVLLAMLARLLPVGGAVGGTAPEEALAPARGGGSPAGTGPAGPEPPGLLVLMSLVLAATAFHWAVITKHALDRGIFNFDSLWYHMPFAASMAQSHSVTGMVHVETVFTNWFYPQNSELLHAVGMVLTGRDTLSLFVNFGWLAVAFLAAYCIGRPYGRGSLTVIAAGILLECHTLVVRDPGSGKNDLAAAALLLAAIAILVEAWVRASAGRGAESSEGAVAVSSLGGNKALPRPWVGGWPLAAAGLAAGLAAGTRVTVLAMVGALMVAVILLAPRGRRWAAAAWWLLPALAGGGFWYLRNLVVAGNPIPEIEKLGPISLPHPERLQEGRPDFSIVHYATDTGVWRSYFAPGLHDAFGLLWPLILVAAAVAAAAALFAGRDRIVRALGGVAMFGLLAYLFTPLSAAGAEGEPVGFGINIRYAVPALLAGLVLVPLPRAFDRRRAQLAIAVVLTLVFLITDRPDEALHDGARLFALAIVFLALVVPAALLLGRRRGAPTSAVLAGGVALTILAVALGYPLQRHYLEHRFRNEVAAEAIPGMNLNDAYRWARGVEDARIGLAGTTAGFAGYGFYGTDLTNRVRYLGQEGPHGAFNALPTCAAFRTAVNEADLDYLVTAPFLNFLHPDDPIASPEPRWLRGDPAVSPVLRRGSVTVWRVLGALDPSSCGPLNNHSTRSRAPAGGE